MEYEPQVKDEVSYFSGETTEGEDAHIASLESDGVTANLTIDSDSRPESLVPLKQGSFSPVRCYTPRELEPPIE